MNDWRENIISVLIVLGTLSAGLAAPIYALYFQSVPTAHSAPVRVCCDRVGCWNPSRVLEARAATGSLAGSRSSQNFTLAFKTSCSKPENTPATPGLHETQDKRNDPMAEAHFTENEMTTEDGVIQKYLEGEIRTRRDKVIVRMNQIKEDGACINAKEFTHKVEVKAHYGEFVDSGVAWTKRNKEGNLYYSVSMNDPALTMSLWADDEKPGEWVAHANSIRSGA